MEDMAINGALDKLLRVNRVLMASIDMDLSMPLVQTFLTAARNEGRTVNDLAELANGPRSTVSRHLLDMSETLRNGKPGYDLLNRVRHPKDLRSVIFVLTPKGKMVLSQIKEIMES